MENIIFLTLEQIIAIHDNQVELYGGSHGIRELGLLESAVFRPQTTFAGQDMYPSVFDKAAVLMHSLMMNHPFIDANKRTATVSALIFLEINSYRVKSSQNSLIKLALDLESKKMNFNQVSSWLKKHTDKLE